MGQGGRRPVLSIRVRCEGRGACGALSGSGRRSRHAGGCAPGLRLHLGRGVRHRASLLPVQMLWSGGKLLARLLPAPSPPPQLGRPACRTQARDGAGWAAAWPMPRHGSGRPRGNKARTPPRADSGRPRRSSRRSPARGRRVPGPRARPRASRGPAAPAPRAPPPAPRRRRATCLPLGAHRAGLRPGVPAAGEAPALGAGWLGEGLHAPPPPPRSAGSREAARAERS